MYNKNAEIKTAARWLGLGIAVTIILCMLAVLSEAQVKPIKPLFPTSATKLEYGTSCRYELLGVMLGTQTCLSSELWMESYVTSDKKQFVEIGIIVKTTQLKRSALFTHDHEIKAIIDTEGYNLGSISYTVKQVRVDMKPSGKWKPFVVMNYEMVLTAVPLDIFKLMAYGKSVDIMLGNKKMQTTYGEREEWRKLYLRLSAAAAG